MARFKEGTPAASEALDGLGSKIHNHQEQSSTLDNLYRFSLNLMYF